MPALFVPDKPEYRLVNDGHDVAIRYWQEKASYEELVICCYDRDFEWFIFGEDNETDWELSDETAPDGFDSIADCIASVRAFLTLFPRGQAQENALRLLKEFEDANQT